jgi:hypothetical protein
VDAHSVSPHNPGMADDKTPKESEPAPENKGPVLPDAVNRPDLSDRVWKEKREKRRGD